MRRWFVVHFIADVLFAVPLLIAPVWSMQRFGWKTPDPLATRLVGAALMGIGVESLLGRDGSVESFRTMLRLKVIWSVSANVGIALTLLAGDAPWGAYAFQGIFLVFSATWITYARRLRAGANSQP